MISLSHLPVAPELSANILTFCPAETLLLLRLTATGFREIAKRRYVELFVTSLGTVDASRALEAWSSVVHLGFDDSDLIAALCHTLLETPTILAKRTAGDLSSLRRKRQVLGDARNALMALTWTAPSQDGVRAVLELCREEELPRHSIDQLGECPPTLGALFTLPLHDFRKQRVTREELPVFHKEWRAFWESLRAFQLELIQALEWVVRGQDPEPVLALFRARRYDAGSERHRFEWLRLVRRIVPAGQGDEGTLETLLGELANNTPTRAQYDATPLEGMYGRIIRSMWGEPQHIQELLRALGHLTPPGSDGSTLRSAVADALTELLGVTAWLLEGHGDLQHLYEGPGFTRADLVLIRQEP